MFNTLKRACFIKAYTYFQKRIPQYYVKSHRNTQKIVTPAEQLPQYSHTLKFIRSKCTIPNKAKITEQTTTDINLNPASTEQAEPNEATAVDKRQISTHALTEQEWNLFAGLDTLLAYNSVYDLAQIAARPIERTAKLKRVGKLGGGLVATAAERSISQLLHAKS